MKNLIITIGLMLIIASCSTSKHHSTTGYSYQKPKKSMRLSFRTNDKKKEQITLSNRFKKQKVKIEHELISSLKTIEPIKSFENQKQKHNQEQKVVPDSCDIIMLTNGEEVSVIVTEATDDIIKYRMCNLPDGPIFSKSTLTIFKIKYANGSETIYAEKREIVHRNTSNNASNNKQTHPMAIASIICFILGLSPVGIILSALALHEINKKPSEYSGKTLAIVSLILNILSLIALIALILIIIALFA